MSSPPSASTASATKRSQLAGSVTSSSSLTSRLEPVHAAGAARDLRSRLGKRARGRGPDPARGARDDRGLALEHQPDSNARLAAGSRARARARARPAASSGRGRTARRSIVASSCRIAWQSAPGSTSTWAESDGKPLPTVQTCRSCTSATCGTASIAWPISLGSSGETSSRIRVDSRSSMKLDQKISAATTRLATGSARFQPVASTTAPATAVPTKAARSVATCRKAPRDVQALAGSDGAAARPRRG